MTKKASSSSLLSPTLLPGPTLQFSTGSQEKSLPPTEQDLCMAGPLNIFFNARKKEPQSSCKKTSFYF